MYRETVNKLKKNIRFRQYAKTRKIPLWQVAEKYGITETKLCVLLRHELPEETQDELINVVNKIIEERNHDYRQS